MKTIAKVLTFEGDDTEGEEALLVQVTQEDRDENFGHLACQGKWEDTTCIGQPPGGPEDMTAEVGTLLFVWEEGDPLCLVCLYSDWTSSITIKPAPAP